MRLSTFAALALVGAPTLVTAAIGKLGFALGTKLPDGTCKATQDYEDDFDAIAKASDARIVRGYSASDCDAAKSILPAAKGKGFQVMLGIWPDVQESYDADLEAIVNNAKGYDKVVYAITVGSETLYRGNFTGEELRDKIMDVKEAVKDILPNAKIGTADSWNLYRDGAADAVIKAGVDFFLVNAFGFWQGQEIKNATHTYFDDIMQATAHIQKTAGGVGKVEIWNGETGWPSDGGSDFGAAKAGTKNADYYYHAAVCGMVDWGLNTFVFEAFDEPWKPDSIGDNGYAADEKHWGVMTADRGAKFNLKC